jgi:TolA-binding protein
MLIAPDPRRAILPLVILLAGCGRPAPTPVAGGAKARQLATGAKARGPVQHLELEPIKLIATPGEKGPKIELLDAGGLFERAGSALSAKKNKEAIALYDRLLALFPSSRFVSPALYNAGLAHEWRREFASAATRYRELIRRFGPSKEAVDAGFRLGGCYAELRNWPASAQTFAELLKRKDLSASDRIEALARRGLAQFRLGDARACRTTLRQAVEYHKSIEAVERLDTDFFLGMARYYQAALPHLEFRATVVDARKELAKSLDEKARLLLLSQAGYIDTIKVKNPYWATAAGFQIGSLYREFYTTLLTAVPDFKSQAAKNAKVAKISVKAAQDQLVQVYLEEVHKTVKPLLGKAIRVFEKTVLVAERVGVSSEWVQKSQHQMNELKHLLSLAPKDAVQLVSKDAPLPEDQKPAIVDPKETRPSTRPATKPGDPRPEKAPAERPDPGQEDEPGRVIL